MYLKIKITIFIVIIYIYLFIYLRNKYIEKQCKCSAVTNLVYSAVCVSCNKSLGCAESENKS